MNLSLPEVVGIAPSTQRNTMAHWKNFVLFYRDLMNQVYPIPKRSVEFVILEKYASFLIYIMQFQAGNNYISTAYQKLRDMEAFVNIPNFYDRYLYLRWRVKKESGEAGKQATPFSYRDFRMAAAHL